MIISGVTPNDDFSDIIRLIYETDEYIYSSMCGNDYSYFEKIMLHHLNSKSIFSYKNITVARMETNVAGIVLSFTSSQSLPSMPENNEFDIRNCYSLTMKDYFQELLSEIPPDSLYINNICVEKKYQGLGIAYALIQHVIKNTDKNRILLDCLADNKLAIALYRKCGFNVTDCFQGFSGDAAKPVQCLKFERSSLT